jgi:hypothetical protein
VKPDLNWGDPRLDGPCADNRLWLAPDSHEACSRYPAGRNAVVLGPPAYVSATNKREKPRSRRDTTSRTHRLSGPGKVSGEGMRAAALVLKPGSHRTSELGYFTQSPTRVAE